MRGTRSKSSRRGSTPTTFRNHARIFGSLQSPLTPSTPLRLTGGPFAVTSPITKSNREELIGDLDAFDRIGGHNQCGPEPSRLLLADALGARDPGGLSIPRRHPPSRLARLRRSWQSIQHPLERHAAVVAVMFWAAGSGDARHGRALALDAHRRGKRAHPLQRQRPTKQRATRRTTKPAAGHKTVAASGLDGEYQEAPGERMRADGPGRETIPTIYAHVDAKHIWDELEQAPKPEDGAKRAPSHAIQGEGASGPG